MSDPVAALVGKVAEAIAEIAGTNRADSREIAEAAIAALHLREERTFFPGEYPKRRRTQVHRFVTRWEDTDAS